MKKQLDSLRIERFRQIRELTIPTLGHVNLVVGGNNSGKSTLLEALRFFAAGAAPSLLEELLGLRGEIQALPQKKEASLLTSGSAEALCNLFFGRKFPSEDGASIYVGSTSGQHFVRLEHIFHLDPERDELENGGTPSPTPQWKRMPKNDTLPISIFAYEAVEISISGQPAPWVIDLEKLFDVSPRFERQMVKLPLSYVPPGSPVHPGLAEAWDDIVLTDGEQFALDALRIIEPKTAALAFVQKTGPSTLRLGAVRSLAEDRVAVVKLSGSDSPVPLSSMGDGMTRVLHLILAALQAKDGFLLIDEFENGLHHSVQSKVWEMLFGLARTRGLQIFATTHSNDCVRAFSQVAQASGDIDGKLLKLERMPDDGQTVAATLGEDDLSNLLDAGIEVRG
jgi:hypothetical protein